MNNSSQYTEIEIKKILIAEMCEQAKRQNKTHQFENKDIWKLMFCAPAAALKSCKILGLVPKCAKLKKA